MTVYAYCKCNAPQLHEEKRILVQGEALVRSYVCFISNRRRYPNRQAIIYNKVEPVCCFLSVSQVLRLLHHLAHCQSAVQSSMHRWLKYKKDVTPLLVHWSHIFLAVTHWNEFLKGQTSSRSARLIDHHVSVSTMLITALIKQVGYFYIFPK